ncbi:hypothetical protein HOK51_10610 [Candidatus Woesearchaeota archaeon]|jgi:hypothetical protein|nr:hypothetical protein [Candidatus Woesearchaeota archaeon]MBT6520272.1 hypothetical protein [Candidatus Woesearchaeota archaeon]MBT7368818.1 hypothetical protein [Candidatus Woesearchaeota archaeon]
MAFYHEMGSAFLEILKAPFKDASAMWVLAPIIIIWVILIIYFDTHKKEELGWNTALGNGISLFWINVDLMRYMFSNSFANFTWSKFLIVLFVLAYAGFITYISFSHKFSPRITYMLAYPTPIYFLAFMAIIWVYGGLHFSIWVIIDLILMYGIIELITLILRKTLPESPKDEEENSNSSSSSDFGSSSDSSSNDSDDLSDLKL